MEKNEAGKKDQGAQVGLGNAEGQLGRCRALRQGPGSKPKIPGERPLPAEQMAPAKV